MYWTVPYLVSMLFADLLSLHLVIFLMFFILVHVTLFLAADACLSWSLSSITEQQVSPHSFLCSIGWRITGFLQTLPAHQQYFMAYHLFQNCANCTAMNNSFQSALLKTIIHRGTIGAGMPYVIRLTEWAYKLITTWRDVQRTCSEADASWQAWGLSYTLQ